jgi:hypothetical protein
VGLVPGRDELRRVPEDRPEGEEGRRRDPDREPDRQAADQPPADPDVEGGQGDKHDLAVRGKPTQGDERQEEQRRQRRERDQAAGDAVAGVDRQDVLVVLVARRRIADGGMALEEGRSLPDEVIVWPLDQGPCVDGKGHQHEADPDGGRQPGQRTRFRPSIRPGIPGATLCYAPIHLHARAGADPR